MISLFNEMHNSLFLLLCQLVNEIHDGADYTQKDILRRITSLPEFQYSEAPEIEKETAIIQKLFHFEKTTELAQLFEDAPIPCLPTNYELSWLKNMLTDDEFSFLLPSELRRDLTHRLEHISPLYPVKKWKKIHALGDDTQQPVLQKHLATIQTAFQKKCCLQYINIDLQKKQHSGTAAPCRLEYDLSNNVYHLIIWNDLEERAIKLTVNKLESLALSPHPLPKNLDQKLTSFFATHKTQATLRLRNKLNAVERCFALFSSYDKESYLEDDDTYILIITYYTFDHYDITNKILSLGSAVTVISPSDLRKKIITCLQESYQKYCD